jgi:hypothetical protein
LGVIRTKFTGRRTSGLLDRMIAYEDNGVVMIVWTSFSKLVAVGIRYVAA